MASAVTIPLIIDGENIHSGTSCDLQCFTPNNRPNASQPISVVGATPEQCSQAIDSSVKAFAEWRHTSPDKRWQLFNRAALILTERGDEIRSIVEEEIGCSKKWAAINLQDSIGLLETVAAATISGVFSGIAPIVRAADAQALVFKEPLGVVLGIAPWNAPLILGIRAVAAAVAAGNTVILKGSELSPRTHFFIANLFRDAGFPAGVVNFLVHRREDAAECFERLISHPSIRKCNFTGSTAVGRYVACRAATYLKPVLLELGGKNYAIVLDDADLEQAVDEILEGAFLNSGQICMSTDLALVSRTVQVKFRSLLRSHFSTFATEVTRVINSESEARIQALLHDAREKGSNLTSSLEGSSSPSGLSATVIEDVSSSMEYWTVESFGPVLGIRVFDHISEVTSLVNSSSYGLSAAIFTKNHLGGLHLARSLEVGAVHVNGSTVHDEPALPHGGVKESGWGRFGSHWGVEEFLQTKTVILNP